VQEETLAEMENDGRPQGLKPGGLQISTCESISLLVPITIITTPGVPTLNWYAAGEWYKVARPVDAIMGAEFTNTLFLK